MRIISAIINQIKDTFAILGEQLIWQNYLTRNEITIQDLNNVEEEVLLLKNGDRLYSIKNQNWATIDGLPHLLEGTNSLKESIKAFTQKDLNKYLLFNHRSKQIPLNDLLHFWVLVEIDTLRQEYLTIPIWEINKTYLTESEFKHQQRESVLEALIPE